MDYVTHLSKDKKFAPLLAQPLPPLQLRSNLPLRLMASIMSQQLHTKVAKIIFHRFLDIYKGEEPTLQQVLATDTEVLRSIGLSYAKIKYIQNVARFCIDQEVSDTMLQGMDNEAIIELLTQIKGVGRWTVEMLLMFSLGREDVFSIDDLGVRNAMIQIYNIKAENKKELYQKMVQISNKWKPFRTFACMHLWRWKDVKPNVAG